MKRAISILVALAAGIALYLLIDSRLGPSIELTGISSDSVISMRDTLSLNLKFSDNDGDIGDSIAGPSMVMLEDTAYSVSQQIPILIRPCSHSLGPVNGKLKVLVDLLPLLDTTMQRTTRLKVYITDRKGHKSNVVETTAIRLSRSEF